MNILVLGAGKVGRNIAKNLARQTFDVCIVDVDIERLKSIISYIISFVLNGLTYLKDKAYNLLIKIVGSNITILVKIDDIEQIKKNINGQLINFKMVVNEISIENKGVEGQLRGR